MDYNGIYTFKAPRSVIAGINSLELLVKLVKEYSASKALIITDMGVWNAGLADRPLKMLKQSGIEVAIVNTVPPEPEIGQVQGIYNEAVKHDSDIIIGIGGGSAMDTAKLVSVMITNKMSLEEMVGADKVLQKGIPCIMIPTTAGTGSEATPNAIVTIPQEELKVGIVSNYLIPDCVILDPAMTVKLPPAITASTGMDAFTHALECFISKKSNPFSDTLALKAIRLISGSIIRAFQNGEDIAARHDMLLGSFYGGMCIASSGTAAVHALAYPLGGKFRIPHGVSNAMLLPHVTEFNKDTIVDKLVDIGVEMKLETFGLNASSKANITIDAIFGLVKELKIPQKLSNFNITINDLEVLVGGAAKVTRLLDNNPKELTNKDIESIYLKLL